jgi:prepilin-type N-terminal cleavage/methylation domain-containing protein
MTRRRSTIKPATRTLDPHSTWSKRMNDPRRIAPGPRGFTLIEIVVVLAIIGILSALALMVGSRVKESSRIELTKSLVRVLDSTQESYFHDRDAKVPYKYTDGAAQPNEFGIIDGRIAPVTGSSSSDRAEPSVTFCLLAMGESTSVQSAIGGFDSRFVVRSPIVTGAPPANPLDFSTIYTGQGVAPQPSAGAGPVYGLVLKDPWGNALRYVHPRFQGGYGDFSPDGVALGGAPGRETLFNLGGTFKLKHGAADYAVQFRRSFRPSISASDIGDADEGLCTGGRGYFYSTGPDSDPGTRADNVYINRPQFPSETAKY